MLPKSSAPLLFALVLIALLTACGGTPKDAAIPPEQMIAKSWKLNKLDLKNEIVGPELLGTASFTFYKNGRYEILMGDLERGKWSLSANKKVLITSEDGANVSGEMDIAKLTPDLLILTNTGNDKPMTMELVPIK
jgi:hypothetical protein